MYGAGLTVWYVTGTFRMFEFTVRHRNCEILLLCI